MRQLFFLSMMVLLFTPFSVMAEDREGMYDYYDRLKKENKSDYDDEKGVSDYGSYEYENPFDVPKEKKEDRIKRIKPMKPIERDNGVSSQKRSSQQVLDWMMSTR